MVERPLTGRVHDFHQLDLHFLHASRSWRMNKREIFADPGSSGLFEYVCILMLFHVELRYIPKPHTLVTLESSSVSELVLDVSDAFKSVSESDIEVLASERRNIYRQSKDYLPNRVPKELASISEQTLIPIYLDGLPRPPRKCRIITS